MARKKRRRARTQPPRVPYSRPEGVPRPAPKGQGAPVERVNTAVAEVAPPSAEDEFAHVRHDLVRITVLAVLIFGVQFALKLWWG